MEPLSEYLFLFFFFNRGGSHCYLLQLQGVGRSIPSGGGVYFAVMSGGAPAAGSSSRRWLKGLLIHGIARVRPICTGCLGPEAVCVEPLVADIMVVSASTQHLLPEPNGWLTS